MQCCRIIIFVMMSNGRSFDFSCPYSVAAGSQTDAFEIEISDGLLLQTLNIVVLM